MLGYVSRQVDDESCERLKDEKELKMRQRRDAMIERSDKKRELRSQYVKKREAREAEAALQSSNVAEQRLNEVRQTYLLAEELSRRKKAELKEWLKSDKGNCVPIPSNCNLEKERLRIIEEKVQEESHNADLINQWYSDDKYIKRQKEEAEQKKRNYRRDLQNQLIDNKRRLREKAEEMHRERKVIEEVMERIHNEDQAIEKRKKETAALLREEEEAFFKARQFWKEKRKELLKKEFQDIARLTIEKELNERKALAKKIDNTTAREELQERLAKKITEEKMKKQEREEICRELYLAEKDSEVANEEIRLKLKKNRVAMELLADMERQHRAAADKKAKENAIDAAFGKYLADERKAVEEKEKKKEKERQENKMRYGKDLRDTILKNQVQHALDILKVQTQSN